MKNTIRFLSITFLSLTTTFSFAQKQNSESDSLKNGTDSSKSLFSPIVSAVEFPSIRFEKLKIGGIFSMDYYANPYLQVFGGDPIGIPIETGSGVGLIAGLGTPYSGPFETDYIEGGLHLGYLKVAAISRMKDLVYKYSSNGSIEDTRNQWIGNWNNLYMPSLGVDLSIELPFLSLSYFTTIDSGNNYNPPVIVRNSVSGEPMKNNVVRGEHFNFELRVPNLIVGNSKRAKLYFAREFGEYHIGAIAREIKIDKALFDWRVNVMFPGKRDFQMLFEMLISQIFDSFGRNSAALGPSVRLGKTPSDNFGVISAFLNLRLKIGDFIDDNHH
jgi:hypothetical protein